MGVGKTKEYIEQAAKIVETSGTFRDFLLSLDSPRIQLAKGLNCREHTKAFVEHPDTVGLDAVAEWKRKYYSEDYRGFTTDGNVRHDLWQADPKAAGPTREMVLAAEKILVTASAEEATAFRYPLEAREWRAWSNPDLVIIDAGMRLEDMSRALRDAVHDLLKVSTSPEGYLKIWHCMLTNEFVGELLTLPKMFSVDCYHFCLFGDPAEDKPWGFNLYGHHLCVNFFTLNGEVIIGPNFMAAEPNLIDEGPNKGVAILKHEEALGLALMKSFSPEQQRKATLQGDIDDLDGSTMPPGRWHPIDLRHLGGAFQDNRVVPFEGLCAREMTEQQRQNVLEIIGAYNEMLPPASKELMMQRVVHHLDETYFAWIGPVTDTTPFYFRVHSPIVMDEFDHHNGAWLANAVPKKYHIHTIQRLPNRGDYGTALVDEWREKQRE